MKKNKMMRIASVLLVAVILTTCAISGTFAKYVTENTGSDSARVAKFGVAIVADTFNMFTNEYRKDDTSATFTGEFSVQSDGTGSITDVLAPGTSGSFANIAITGKPEVAVDVSVVGTVSLSDNWIAEGNFYCPVTITVGSDSINGLDYDNKDDFANAIKEKIDGKSAQYAPIAILGNTYDNTNLDLAWNWDFENAVGTANTQTDTKDTALGDAAVTGELTITIGIDITVTQID